MVDPSFPAAALASLAQHSATSAPRLTSNHPPHRRSRTLGSLTLHSADILIIRLPQPASAPPSSYPRPWPPAPPAPPPIPPSVAPGDAAYRTLITLLSAKAAEVNALLAQVRDRRALTRQASAVRYGRRGSVPTIELAQEGARWDAIEAGLVRSIEEMRERCAQLKAYLGAAEVDKRSGG